MYLVYKCIGYSGCMENDVDTPKYFKHNECPGHIFNEKVVDGNFKMHMRMCLLCLYTDGYSF
jgi:hypothetical protein